MPDSQEPTVEGLTRELVLTKEALFKSTTVIDTLNSDKKLYEKLVERGNDLIEMQKVTIAKQLEVIEEFQAETVAYASQVAIQGNTIRQNEKIIEAYDKNANELRAKLSESQAFLFDTKEKLALTRGKLEKSELQVTQYRIKNPQGGEDLKFREIVKGIRAELSKATEKFPLWPTDPNHAVVILNEEVGELNQAITKYMYEIESDRLDLKVKIAEEAIQVGAMAVRFMLSLSEYDYQEGHQHSQSLDCGSYKGD